MDWSRSAPIVWEAAGFQENRRKMQAAETVGGLGALGDGPGKVWRRNLGMTGEMRVTR
jgi:hypothetical protein